MNTAQATAQQAQGWFRALAGPRAWGDSVERGIERAARRAGLSPSQGKRLWYGDLASVPAHVFISLQERYVELCEAEARKTALAKQSARQALDRGTHADFEGLDSTAALRDGRED